MGPLDLVVRHMEAQPWSVRRRFIIRRNGGQIFVQRGGMQAGAREVADGQIEVVYEHALHEETRERVTPEVAARLLLAVMLRDRLCRVELSEAGPSSPADRLHE